MTKKSKGVLDVPGVTERTKKDGTTVYKVVVCLQRDGTGKRERRIATDTPEPGESKRDIKKKLEALRLRATAIKVSSVMHWRTSGRS